MLVSKRSGSNEHAAAEALMPSVESMRSELQTIRNINNVADPQLGTVTPNGEVRLPQQ